jgi:hypothetical protein
VSQGPEVLRVSLINVLARDMPSAEMLHATNVTGDRKRAQGMIVKNTGTRDRNGDLQRVRLTS